MDRDPADGRHIRIKGELDTFNARDLLQTLEPTCQQRGDLRLDVSEIDFMDSGGVRAIILLAKALGEGGELLIASPRNEVARLLDLIGAENLPNVRVLFEREASASPISSPSSAAEPVG